MGQSVKVETAYVMITTTTPFSGWANAKLSKAESVSNLTKNLCSIFTYDNYTAVNV